VRPSRYSNGNFSDATTATKTATAVIDCRKTSGIACSQIHTGPRLGPKSTGAPTSGNDSPSASDSDADRSRTVSGQSVAYGDGMQ
jgi:hypothetical protein